MTFSNHITRRFFDLLLAANRPHLDGFHHWLFHPGMLFQSRQQWWAREKPRSTPHEGLDLCWFEDISGTRRSLDHTTLIPAPCSGTVVKISPDFLGQSIFLACAIVLAEDRRLYTAFGHTDPRAGLDVGQQVLEGDIIATVSTPDISKTTVPPHLHLTLALTPDTVTLDQLAWDNIGTDPSITLLDPLAVFPTPYAMLPPSH
jgi:murein DD-endopeptidase MepM/ murein hydrolase activator NlpD